VRPCANPIGTGRSGHIDAYTSAPNGYESPWDINSLHYVEYYFSYSVSWDNIYVRVTPYIGLNDHCPVMPSVYQYPFNWQPVYFDLVNNQKVQPVSVGDPDITPAPPQATAQEVQLLKDYGKVMYYKVEFGLGKNNYTDTVYVLALEDESGDALPYSLSITDTFDNDLYFHNGAGSMEIVLDPQQLGATGAFNFVRSEAPISVSFLGADQPLKIVTSYTGFVTLFVGYHP